MMSITFDKVMRGMMRPVDAGKTIACSLPSGCVLMCNDEPVVYDGPFVVTATAEYRIDCVTYTSPVTATLTIT